MNRTKYNRGFSLVSAVFLLVVVALIAGYAVSIGTSQQADSSLALLGKRADFAARSGLEWAIARVLQDGSCPVSGTTFSPAGTGISNFVVSVSCSSATVSEGASTYLVYSLGVTATLGSEGTEDFARRSLSAQVSGI
jgi:MSHA biogenesis protein MshP